MSSVRKQLSSMGLGRIAGSIAAAARPSVRLVAADRGAKGAGAGGGGCGNLGGRPSLPADVEWPVWNDGQPLAFIAQLDLASIAAVVGAGEVLPLLPKTGLLLFFYEADEQPWGFDPRHRGGARVIYLPETKLGDCAPRTPPRELAAESRFKPLSLSAVVETTLPGAGDEELGELARQGKLTEEEFLAYMEFLDERLGKLGVSCHRMGGYADQVQSDLKLEAELVSSHGLNCGETTGFTKGRNEGLDKGAGDWELLLQVDSEERIGMMWGDLGRIYFLIRKDQLERAEFDGAWLILQCT